MTDKFDLAEFLPYRLAYISERVSQRLSADYGKSHGLTVAEWRILVNLQRLGTASVRDIQVFTNLEKSRVSRAVTRMEKAGLVAKQAGTDDARLVEIGLSEKGIDTLNKVLPSAIEVEHRLIADLTEAQRETFFEVIEKFHRILDDDPDARPRFEKSR
ncbi:MarR family winged helix-turn-helix transcriptional regulator [Thalassococcus lentus]|uniref:MarR family transcriptional regulator n=1 Tax=Thalassococcus lentus TaxID=1210524 RepID=A0ABT4XS56_9RHOB|nr:MarR family transcriptional regulator [Thalassococcus lentus]MDA7424792.1 MarR family transcriptional regulator [Thalassococcus lentus]